MQKWKGYLESICEVALFDYDYMREGGKRPDPPPQLIAAHRSALAEIRKKSSGPIFLIGKSMGGRIGCHVALEEEVAGLICLGIRSAAAVIGENCVISATRVTNTNSLYPGNA